jgi:predicted ATPase/class 3 adenylate cyclase
MTGSQLPTGTVTFLFSDIEGSTKLLQKLGDSYSELLADHARIFRLAIGETGGTEVSTEGDSFFAVFPRPVAAVEAAARIQRSLTEASFLEPVRVRMGLHTGEGRLGGENYIGIDVNRAARIGAAGHGGQVLLSDTTRSLVEHSLPDGVTVLDLGEHRLKDLAHPEHLYQLVVEGLQTEFPPPRTLDARPNNLPIQITSFIGREKELAKVKSLLMNGARLLTLTGPGGTGKTRLALQAAAETLTEFADGAYFVDLAPIADSGLVISTIAETLGVTEGPARPLQESLQAHLKEKEVLLVLDNFEQVVEAGAAVEQLLQAAPRLKVLVTSRAVLHRYGESEFPVPPLALPDPSHLPDLAALSQYEAVALFIERAMAVKPSFAVTNDNAPAVADITARLDGLPLAIELAASRVKVLAPQQILERLGQRLPLLTSRMSDAPERRRTLRGTIEWSYDLLDEDERRLFEHVSVFVGGSTIEAMESVCSLAGATDTLDGLASLVDKSLIRQVETDEGDPRFMMLETIREYAQDRLRESGDGDDLARRHAQFFLALAEEAEPNLTGPEGVQWVNRLTHDHDNIRAALRWSIETNQADVGLRLAGAVWRFWHQRAHFQEARAWFDELLSLPGAAEAGAARAKGLTGLGGIAYWQGDYSAAESAYEEAVAIQRDVGDERDITEAMLNLSFMPALRGDVPASLRLYEEVIEGFERIGDTEKASYVKAMLGYGLMMEGDVTAARPLIEESFNLAERSGDAFMTAGAYQMMGQLERLSGNLAEAGAQYREALRRYREAGDNASTLEPIEAIALVAAAQGDFNRAVRLTAAARAAREAMGGGPPPEWLIGGDVVGEARKVLGDEAVEQEMAKGAAMTLEDAMTLALAEE